MTPQIIRRLLPNIRLTFALGDDVRIRLNAKKHLYLCRGSRRREEVVMAKKIAALAGPTGIIFDLGANIGLYSLVFAADRRTRRVFAFEPFEDALEYLRANVDRNGLTNVEIHPVLLSNRTGTCRFTVDAATMCTSHISADGEAGVNMRCWDLDSYMEAHQLPVPDVIKIDVEGADVPILEGMQLLLKKRRTHVFLEGGLRDDRGHISAITYLKSFGYSIRDVDLSRTLTSDTPEYAFIAVP